MTGPRSSTSSNQKSWLNYLVRVDLGSQTHSNEFQNGLAKLKKIEAWLHKNHLPMTLTDEFGNPRSEIVTVFFDTNHSAKALAFRGLCSELGIASTLLSQRVTLNRDRRTLGY
ncbi:MAG: hypothetical protein O7A03_11005, partial [Alphaproteobacteria bacterium]|nr:hypothetical protein [Alphaproteobacteria bacterium]